MPIEALRKSWLAPQRLDAGAQPTLKPGEAFRYVSGCPLPTPSGVMAGEFEMEGLEVLGSNMRMERVGGRLRLVSEAGTIELAPATGATGA